MTLQEEIRDFYNNLAKNYDAVRFADTYHGSVADREQQFIIERLPRNAKVLEVGADTGRFYSGNFLSPAYPLMIS